MTNEREDGSPRRKSRTMFASRKISTLAKWSFCYIVSREVSLTTEGTKTCQNVQLCPS